jgi:diketogulonate reductase-like aldo/keto reductase
MPVLGQGTWRMGETRRDRRREVSTLRLGIELGLTLIDTAEMYADGGAEEVVADAISGRRDEVFLVSKVLPQNASRTGTIRAAEASLKRLRTDRIDLYLLHWPGAHPLEDTLDAFAQLRGDGKILHYGVSNFDVEEMQHAERIPAGERVAANQVIYNLLRRGSERRLLPWCAARGIPVMAYSPLAQGRLDRRRALETVASRRGASPAQVALAWTLRLPGVVSIPKASESAHVRDNAAAAAIRLTTEDLADLDRDYPCPDRDVPLEML